MHHSKLATFAVAGLIALTLAGCGSDSPEYQAPPPATHAPLTVPGGTGATPGSGESGGSGDPGDPVASGTGSPGDPTPGATDSPSKPAPGTTHGTTKPGKGASAGGGTGKTMPGQPVVTAPATPGPADIFEMPGLAGLDVLQAQDALSVGGAWRITWSDASGRGRQVEMSQEWKVCGQSPRKGTSVDFNVQVTLSAVPRAEKCP